MRQSRKAFPKALLVAGVILVAPRSAGAQVLFDRSDPWLTSVHQSTPGLNIDHGSRVASQFFLGTSSTLGSVRLWGRQTEGSSDPGKLSWWIYGQPTFRGLPDWDRGPGDILYSGTTSTSRVLLGSSDGYDRYEYNFFFPNLALTEGTFWLALNASEADAMSSFLWDYGQFVNDTHVSYTDTDVFPEGTLLHNTTMRYQLLEAEATVTPEPLSMTLLGTGLVGIGAAARRRKRKELEAA